MAKQTFEVPVHNEDFVTDHVIIDLDNKIAHVHVGTGPEGFTENPKMETKVIDLTALFQAELTQDEIAAVKKAFNLIVATAWDKQLSDITGDVL